MHKITIHLGLHKTASTFLQKRFFSILEDDEVKYINLRTEIPDFLIYILNENELQYKSEIALNYFNNYLSENNIIKKHVIISDEQFCGSPWDNASLRKIYFDRLNKLFPEANYFLLLRNPKELIESLYLQFIKTGGSINWKVFLKHKRYPLSFSLKSYLNYVDYIEYIKSQLNNDNFKFFYYEDMRYNPIKFLSSLATFIVPQKVIDSESLRAIVRTKDNKSISPFYVTILIYINKFFKSEKQPFLLFPMKIRHALVRIIIYLSNSKSKRRIIPQSIIEEFCNDIPNIYYDQK